MWRCAGTGSLSAPLGVGDMMDNQGRGRQPLARRKRYLFLRTGSSRLLTPSTRYRALTMAGAVVNPSPSMVALIEASESKSGLFMADSDSAIYTLDGALKKNSSLESTRNLPIHRKNTIMYDLADAMFMAAYQQHFDDIVVQ